MRPIPAFVLLALLVPFAAPVLAQDTRVEISPFGGWRWGGELEASDNVLFDEDVSVDDSSVFGLRLNVAVTRNFQLELQASRQATQFTTGDDTLFGPNRGLLDVDLDTLQLGVLFQGGSGQVHPYGVLGLGFTRLDPEGSVVDADERLSASAGGGVKVMVSRNLGFRFEGRYYWTDIEEDDDRRFFDDGDFWEWDGDLYQGEVTVGLVLAM
jgi:opacity protein-like surface antigen